MMKKLKKAILPIMLGMFLCGGVAQGFNDVYHEEQTVYAAQEGSVDGFGGAGEMPVFTMDENGKLNTGGMTEASKNDFFNTVFREYKTVVVFVSGIALITMIIFFIINFLALGNSKGNPQERQKAISGLIMSGIGCAGLGSVTLIVSLFYGIL